MNKIAVIFPGMGYTKDRPLLYYAGKIARNCGYNLIFIRYEDISFDKETLRDHGEMTRILGKCINSAEDILSDTDFSEAGDVIFISKSLGCVVAAAIAKRHGIQAKHIFFTPIEQFRDFADDDCGIVFYGGGDPFADPDTIGSICRAKRIEAYRIEGANHSLEVDDVKADIDNLSYVMNIISDKISGNSIYNYSVQARDGSLTSLADYRGQVLLILNSATGCGFTPQYEALERIYRKYHDRGFTILDFPCNQFGRQAPGSASEIHSFCTSRYDITFPQFMKIEVNGPGESELFTYLKSKQGFKGFGESPEADYMRKKLASEIPGYENTPDIKWNFTKFLVDTYGNVISRFEPTEDMAVVEAAIERMFEGA